METLKLLKKITEGKIWAFKQGALILYPCIVQYK